MPRRTSARTVTPPASPRARQTPYDARIHQLRRHWKWAALSQFLCTFAPLLAMPDVGLADVENDLVHSTNRVLPRIMQRLLVALTQDRKITADSWQNVLRRQYQRRDPLASPIGLPARTHYYVVESSRASTAPPEAPLPEPQREGGHDQAPSPLTPADDAENPQDAKAEAEDETLEPETNWLDLSMLAKLDSLHALAEWQFQNPNRLRQQMKTDDEQASWRIEPIGYDAKSNAYWLIGGDRLWIQREPPRSNLKRKRKPPAKSRSVAKEQPPAAKRQRTDVSLLTPEKPSAARSTRSRAQPSPGSREGRAAKTRANQRLDAQAKDLAEFRRQMASSRTRSTSSPRKPTGIRVSARLRGAVAEDDEWQEIPDEWLANSDTHTNTLKNPPSVPLATRRKRAKTGLESDDSSISELTELSEGEDDEDGAEVDPDEKPSANADAAGPVPAEDEADVIPEDQRDEDAKSSDPFPPDFVEWETICVTIEEWESVGQQFEKATHYAEKALYKVLSQHIVPMVTAELREVERKRHMEEAVVHRKRSSRIAMREIEKEEERAAMRKRAEQAEKMSRAQRLEARHQKEQAERLKRENAREQRRKERELQEQQEAEAQEAETKPNGSVVDEEASIALLPTAQGKVSTTRSMAPMNGTGSGSRSPVENWELDCEVCGRKGFNQDDGVPLLCCGVCGKWQHIVCHDKQNAMAGRPQRNWDAEEFICRRCYLLTSKGPSLGSSSGFISSGVGGVRGHTPGVQGYYGQPQSTNHHRSYPTNDYYRHSPSNTRYPYDRPDTQTIAPSPPSHSHTPVPSSTSVTFAHYQPQQGGFSTSRPTYSVQEPTTSQHARYINSSHGVSTSGVTPYTSSLHNQPIAHLPTHGHEWPSYPRTANSYPVNGNSPLRAQGVQSYYNGHTHASYSQMRGAANPAMLRQYPAQHVPSYQQSK